MSEEMCEKEHKFEAEIEPLVIAIQELCEKYRIPVNMVFAFAPPKGGLNLRGATFMPREFTPFQVGFCHEVCQADLDGELPIEKLLRQLADYGMPEEVVRTTVDEEDLPEAFRKAKGPMH